ncbi:sensor domain-containing diguanylate cyclase [Paenibacillus septentrionalis]|uniref:Sensor domain-containing diguanylate cyclase n=2 Tax=Paenibacillus septentrionalis TaxID=429342 RepID=A0ABW1UYR5_9BACL
MDGTFGMKKPTIWFANEDFHDADEPYLPELFKESFHAWFEDAQDLDVCQYGVFRLYSRSASFYSTEPRNQQQLNSANWDEVMNRLANQCIQSESYTVLLEQNVQYSAVPIRRRKDNKMFAVFVSAVNKEHAISKAELEGYMKHYRVHFYRAFESVFVKEIMLQKSMIDKEATHRERLFLISKRLYDQIDAESVVREMLHSLEELYQDSKIHLYLSQDHLEGDSRVRPLEFRNSTNNIVTEAFLEGKHCIDRDQPGYIRLAIPMNGKQAAYGVLCIEINRVHWDESDLPAFMLIADTAGSAFENAKLYEQSNMLINELRIINEMTKRLNQSLRSREIFQYATAELLKVFNADYCCVLQLDRKKNEFKVRASNLESLLGKAYANDYGFTGIVYRTREALITSDYWNKQNVSSELMEDTNSRSLIGAPIFVDGEVAGVILVTHRQANYFSYDNFKLLQVVSTHIGLAITNASLHAEMHKMIITDNLTNLHARHYLDEQIQRKQRVDMQGSLILVDIDFFKTINDTYGHQVGDRILIQVSAIIKSSIRNGDIAARWGGEELAIYLPNVPATRAVQIAERIRMRVEHETDPKVTVSCGISEWEMSHDKISVESLFYRADMALYESKKNGRNRINIG